MQVGTIWESDFWFRKYGMWEIIPTGKGWNPRAIKNYYFSKIDMTITVNVVKGEIVSLSIGKGGL
jgi:hypothetical protein